MAKTIWQGTQAVTIPPGMRFTLLASMDREGNASVRGASGTVVVNVANGQGSGTAAGIGSGEMLCEWYAWNSSGPGHCTVTIVLADGTTIPMNTGGGGSETTPGELPETQIILSFPATGGQHALGATVASTSEREVFEHASEWLSCAFRIITCEAHTEKTSRTGTVSIRRESLVSRVENGRTISEWQAKSRTIYNVTQRGIFYLSPETLTFPPQGGSASVEFKNEKPVSITPRNGDFLWGKFTTGGQAQVYRYPLCVHGGATPQKLPESITYTTADGQTATLSVEINPPTRTQRTFTVSPKLFAPPPGKLTATALYPETDSVRLGSLAAAAFLKQTGKTESPGQTVWTFDVAHPGHLSASWKQGISITALFIAHSCEHDTAITEQITLQDNWSDEPGGGDGNDNGGGEPTDPGDGNGGEGNGGETPPAAGTLSLIAEPELLSCVGGELKLTASFNEAVSPEAIELFIPEEAREWISVTERGKENASSLTWTLNVAANTTGTPRKAKLSAYTATLAVSAQITQAESPGRSAAAFYRNKRLWKPTVF